MMNPNLPPTEKAEISGRYSTLDAFRGMAALLVAVFHLGQRMNYDLVPEGYLAVDLFFMLSGFVIAMNYSDKLYDRMSLRDFMLKRAIRLYPLYLLGVLFGLGVVLRSFMHHYILNWPLTDLLTAGLFNVLVLPAPAGFSPFLPAPLFPFNGPSWSLFFEILVNFIFGLILFRIRSGWLAGVCALAAVYLGFRTGAPEWFSAGWAWSSIDIGVARAIFSFSLGTLLWRWQGSQRGRRSWLALVMVAATMALLCFDISPVLREPFDLCVVFIVLPALVLGGIKLEIPRLVNPLFFFLGDISYAVYAIHAPLLSIFLYYSAIFQLSPVVTIIAFLIFIISLSYAAHRLLDIPVRRRLTKWRGARAAAIRPA